MYMLAQIYCSKVHIGVSVRHLSLGYIYICCGDDLAYWT